jgi:hypothetical protein
MNSNENPERSVRLQLAAAAVRGILSGAVRAVVSWFIQEHIHLL